MPEVVVSVVDAGGRERPCSLVWEALEPHRRYRITAHLEEFGTFTGAAADCFSALRQLRLGLEEASLRLCCAGARTNAWCSGMQGDMGQGLVCYILPLPRQTGRPDQVSVFAPAPAGLVGTSAEQAEHFQRWRAVQPPR
jgi:hypothetical protein